jgi:type I restriction enzyme S subunit
VTETLPRHWELVTIGDLAEVSGGLTKNASKRNSSAARAPLVSVAAVRLRRIDETAIGEVGLLESDGDRASLEEGDLLMVEGNGSLEHIGRVALWDRDIPGARHQNHIIRVRPHEVSSRFLLEWLASPHGRDSIIDAATSATGLYTLSLSKVERLQAPLPPLNEQRRIVATLDAIFEQTSAARARLERLPALLEKLKRSILAAAFRGDLTADWRATHPDVEPARVVLDRIRAERRHRWEADLRARGKDPTKAKYEEPSSIAGADVASLPRLPGSWAWAPAGLICDPITKGTTPPSTDMAKAGDVPYLKVYNLTFDGRIDFTIDPTYVSRETHEGLLARSRVFPGDVLMNIVGPPLGKVGIVDERFASANVNQAIALFRPLAGFDSDYLAHFLLGPATRAWADLSSKATSGQHNLTLELCRGIAIPVPPPREQRALVALLRDALLRIAGLQTSVESMTRQQVRLEHAALAKAFRGDLVPQDPNDEPAAVLLNRIRAARADAPQGSRRGRDQRPTDVPTTGRKSNGHSIPASRDVSLDLVVAAFQQGEPCLTASDIIDVTNLDVSAVKQVLKSLVAAGQVRIHGKARGTAYEWIA